MTSKKMNELKNTSEQIIPPSTSSAPTSTTILAETTVAPTITTSLNTTLNTTTPVNTIILPNLKHSQQEQNATKRIKLTLKDNREPSKVNIRKEELSSPQDSTPVNPSSPTSTAPIAIKPTSFNLTPSLIPSSSMHRFLKSGETFIGQQALQNWGLQSFQSHDLGIFTYKKDVVLPRFDQHMNSTYILLIPYTSVAELSLAVQQRQLWGTDVYTDDSDAVAVLAHLGLDLSHDHEDRSSSTSSSHKASCLDLKLTLRVLPKLKAYHGSQRNGVTSRDWGSTHEGVSFRIENLTYLKTGDAYRFNAKKNNKSRIKVMNQLRKRCMQGVQSNHPLNQFSTEAARHSYLKWDDRAELLLSYQPDFLIHQHRENPNNLNHISNCIDLFHKYTFLITTTTGQRYELLKLNSNSATNKATLTLRRLPEFIQVSGLTEKRTLETETSTSPQILASDIDPNDIVFNKSSMSIQLASATDIPSTISVEQIQFIGWRKRGVE